MKVSRKFVIVIVAYKPKRLTIRERRAVVRALLKVAAKLS